MARRIIQFGTSRFLQAHADLFVHEARLAGQDIGPISVVKTTSGAERRGRIDAMCHPAGFPVRIRGYRDGGVVDEVIQVRSVDQALTAAEDWSGITELVIVPEKSSSPAKTIADFRQSLGVSGAFGTSRPLAPPITAEPRRFYYPSFPLDRSRRLGGDVVDDAVDALDLVDDARRGAAEEIVVEIEIIGGHAVG